MLCIDAVTYVSLLTLIGRPAYLKGVCAVCFDADHAPFTSVCAAHNWLLPMAGFIVRVEARAILFRGDLAQVLVRECVGTVPHITPKSLTPFIHPSWKQLKHPEPITGLNIELVG